MFDNQAKKGKKIILHFLVKNYILFLVFYIYNLLKIDPVVKIL